MYITVAFAEGERQQQAWVTHTYQVIDTLRSLLGHSADAETGQRGYLLTHKPAYLEPYNAARTAIRQRS